jgi:hypothetical protein
MAKMSPQEASDKWKRNTQAAVPDYKAGVERVTEAPGVKAARSQDLMLANLTAAIQSGRWARNVAAVSLEEWKRLTSEKGGNRLAQGVLEGAAKQEAAMVKIYSSIEATMAEVNRIPRGTIEDNINRAAAFMRGMHERPIK